MKTIYSVLITLLFFSASSYSQPQEGGERKKPDAKELLKMIETKICVPLKLDNNQKEVLLTAFKAFFNDANKLMQPGSRPDKSKIDAIAKIRDEKIKKVVSEPVYKKYLELELQTRPKQPEGNKPPQGENRMQR